MPKILIVDDDAAIVALLEDVLQPNYLTCFASDGVGALHQLAVEQPDLVLLDLRMPGMDGAVLLERIRRLSAVPIIVVTARSAQADVVGALNAGADDVIAKPFDIDDLLARIAVVLRRSARVVIKQPGDITVGNLVISPPRGTVTVGGQSVHVTPTEWRILVALATAPGEMQSYASLSLAAYNYADDQAQPAIYTHVLHLRGKLCQASHEAPQILGRHGKGYELG